MNVMKRLTAGLLLAALACSPAWALVLTTTSGGSITDTGGAVWTLGATGDVKKNGTVVAGGGGTGELTVVGTTAWGLDAAPGGHWYTFNGTLWTDQGSGTPPVVPNQVTGLANGTPTSTSAGLTWSPAILATGYAVQLSTSGGAYTSVGTPSGTSYSLTGLSPSTSYAAKVAGTDPTGTGTFATPVSFTTPSSGGGTLTGTAMEIDFFMYGLPPANAVLAKVFSQPTTIAASAPIKCAAIQGATGSTTITFKKVSGGTSTTVGSVNFAASGSAYETCTVTWSSSVSFAAGDVLTETYPAVPDATAANILVSLPATQ